MQGKAQGLEKEMNKNKVSAGLEAKKSGDPKAGLKEKNMDPALQATADNLKKEMTMDKVEKGLGRRMSKDKIQAQGILKSGV